MKIPCKPLHYRSLAWILMLMLGLTSLHVLSLSAAEEESLSLTMIDQADDIYITDTEFQLYYVADVLSDGSFQAAESFAGSGVSLSPDETAETWSARALTLESYLVEKAADGEPILPAASDSTDAVGMIRFTGLSSGLYLLVGKPTLIGQTLYTPLATLITLPYYGEEPANYSNPRLYIKNSSREIEEPAYVALSVLKIWKDKGHESERPNEVTVTLYRDEEEYESIVLNEENSWEYTWYVLEDTSRWQLTEKKIEADYTVVCVQDGMTFVVTNTYQGDTPNAPQDPELPLTGQLWWPISILVIGGLALLLLGVGLRRRARGHE